MAIHERILYPRISYSMYMWGLGHWYMGMVGKVIVTKFVTFVTGFTLRNVR